MKRNVPRTKIIPPPRHTHTLKRPRITESFMQAFEYQLTILQVKAGYGNSTALAESAETPEALAQYQVNDEDNSRL